MSTYERSFTSTGEKFWCHRSQMESYRDSTGKTVISTHISPTGQCNLTCEYCSVSKRTKYVHIEFKTMQRYVSLLKSRGLKAVILTGGGEPTLYSQFNELVRWIRNDMGLSVALITNGTTSSRIDDDVMRLFSWIRVSVLIS